MLRASADVSREDCRFSPAGLGWGEVAVAVRCRWALPLATSSGVGIEFAARRWSLATAALGAGCGTPYASRNRLATGASTVEDADFTRSPSALSRARTSLLETPSCLANSWTRVLPATFRSSPHPFHEPAQSCDRRHTPEATSYPRQSAQPRWPPYGPAHLLQRQPDRTTWRYRTSGGCGPAHW